MIHYYLRSLVNASSLLLALITFLVKFSTLFLYKFIDIFLFLYQYVWNKRFIEILFSVSSLKRKKKERIQKPKANLFHMHTDHIHKNSLLSGLKVLLCLSKRFINIVAKCFELSGCKCNSLRPCQIKLCYFAWRL